MKITQFREQNLAVSHLNAVHQDMNQNVHGNNTQSCHNDNKIRLVTNLRAPTKSFRLRNIFHSQRLGVRNLTIRNVASMATTSHEQNREYETAIVRTHCAKRWALFFLPAISLSTQIAQTWKYHLFGRCDALHAPIFTDRTKCGP